MNIYQQIIKAENPPAKKTKWIITLEWHDIVKNLRERIQGWKL